MLFSGLLDSLGHSDDLEGKWSNSQSEDLLDCPTGLDSTLDRKVSPPFIAVLGSESRIRSGSDPSISKQAPVDQKKVVPCSRSQENSVTSPKSSE